MINGITKDRKYEDMVDFVDKKASKESTNEASVIRAVVHEHCLVLGLANPAEMASYIEKKMKKRCYHLILLYFVFLNRVRERKAEMKPSEENMKRGGDGRRP